MEADVRCNLMGYHLVMWEIAVMIWPDAIRIDIFDVLIQHGAIFNAYYGPCGHVDNILDKLQERIC